MRRSPSLACSFRSARFAALLVAASALISGSAGAQAGPTGVQGAKMGSDQPGVNFDGTGSTCGQPFQLTVVSNPGDGSGSTTLTQLEAVALATGYPGFSETDIALPAEVMWAISRSYNISVDSTGNQNLHYQGVCWFQNSQPEILFAEDTQNHANDVVTLVFAADKYVAYQRASSMSNEFLGLNGAAGIFAFVAAASGEPDLWTLTDPLGWTATFVGFGGSPGDQAGQLWKIASPSGATAFVGASTSIADARTASGWGTSGRIAKAFDSVDRRYTYAFTPIDSINRLTSVTVETRSGTSWSSPGTITEVAKVEYDYYAGSDANGLSGDLRTVTRTTPMSDDGVKLIERKYYRYYKSSSLGPDHGVMLVLDYEGARRFDWTDSSFTNNSFLSADTTALKPYAAAYLEYDSSRRVNSALFSGQCGCSGGGANGLHTLVYASNPSFSGTSGYDTAWHHRVVIGRPDGSYVTQYFDEKGQALSTILSTENPAGSSPTPTHYATKVVRSSTGHVSEAWTPDSIASYTHNDGGGSPSGTFSADSSGLVHLYYRVSSGAAKGFLADEKWRDIASTNEYFVRSLTWNTSTAYATIGSQTLTRPLLASSREYTDAITSGTSGSNLTSYSYAVHSGAPLAIKKITETQPTVSTGKNGSGSTHYVYTQLRADGRMEYRAEKDLETGGRKFVEERTYTSTGQLDTRYEDATVTSGENSDSDFQSDSGALNEFEVHIYDAQGRLVTRTTHDGRTIYRYYSVLADRRIAALSFPDYTTSGGTKYWGPAPYSITNHAGQGELSATLALDSNYTSYAPTYFITESDADPITSIGDGVTLGELRSMTTSVLDNSGKRVTEQRVYFLTPTSGVGTDGTNYDATSFAYDGMGRRIRTKEPHGTITRVDYDKRGHVETRKMGTNDTGLPGSDTTGTSDMAVTESTSFDANGNASSETHYPVGSSSRTTTYTNDVRGRPVLITRPTSPHTFNKFDNLGRVIASGEFSSTASISVGSDDPTTETANRRALSETAYDERGRVYLAKLHKIDEADGSDDDNLESSTWFDEMGRVLKADGEQLVKYRYDRLGRQTHEFILASDGGESAYTDVDDVTGDIVVEERQTTFDADGYVSMTATIARLYNDVGTGETTGALDTNADSDPNKYTESNVEGRIQITAYWYDYLGRETDRAEYGTNGTGNVTTFERSPLSTAPTRSDTVLVSSTVYGKDGTVDSRIDPKEKTTKFQYDHLGRTTAEISNYVNGVPSGSGLDVETSSDDNFVRYEYADGLMTALWVDYDGDGTKDTSAPKDQVTTYFYGTKVGTPSASSIASGHLLGAVKYPDSSNTWTSIAAFYDPTHSDGLDDIVTYAYNAQEELVQKRDQAGNVVDTTYDGNGRETARAVSTLASGFDGTVRRIATTYDSLGRVQLVTQYNAASAGTVVDEVKKLYDSWGNLSAFQQDHDSAVGSGTYYEVSHEYQKATTGRNAVRRTATWYPNGTKYVHSYSTSGSHDGALSRVTSVQDGNGTDLAVYDYNGVGSVVRTTLPVPDVYSSLFGASGTSFTGLDRFDRPVASKWTKDLSTDRDFFSVAVGWDRNSNVTYQDDLVFEGHDALYANDDLNRLTTADEGKLVSGSITNRTRKQEWTLTRTGNWSRDKVDLNGDGDWSDTGELNDTRTHNEVNELQTRDTDSNASTNFTFAYDANGNMTDDGEAYKFEWDAFGQLRRVKNQSNALVSEYWYNGLGYRVRWHYDNKATFGVVDSTDKIYHFVYDERWRIAATYRESDTSPKEQFVYHAAGLGGHGGSSYIDATLLRDKDASTAWTAAANALDEVSYYCQNWRADVVAIVSDAGAMREQARYSAYGVPFGIPLGDVDGDGDCDVDDAALAGDWRDNGPYHVEGDVDLDGDVDNDDVTAVANNEGAELGRGQLTDRAFGSRKGYAGYEFDENVGQKYHVRHRVLDAVLGRWLRRDPIDYPDGMNLMASAAANPVRTTDPAGLMRTWPFPVYGKPPCGPGGSAPEDCCAGVRKHWKRKGDLNTGGTVVCCDEVPKICINEAAIDSLLARLLTGRSNDDPSENSPVHRGPIGAPGQEEDEELKDLRERLRNCVIAHERRHALYGHADCKNVNNGDEPRRPPPYEEGDGANPASPAGKEAYDAENKCLAKLCANVSNKNREACERLRDRYIVQNCQQAQLTTQDCLEAKGRFVARGDNIRNPQRWLP